MPKLEISPNIEAIIFDMEGVIVDSEKIWQKKEQNFLNQFIPKITPKIQKKITGQSTKSIFKMLKQDYNLNIKEADFLQKYHEFGIENIFPNCNLSPNLLIFLKKIKPQYKIALASSSPYIWIDFVLAKFGLRKYFEAIVSSDDLAGKGKPAPDIYLLAAKKLKIKPQNCLVFEDSDNGIIAGKEAGMTVYGFRNGYNNPQTLEKADKIFKNFKEII